MRGRRTPGAQLHSVFARTVHEHRRTLAGWTVGLFAYSLAMTGVYPTIRAFPALAQLHESYPKALRSLFDITDLTTGAGYLRAEIFSLVGPALIIVLAVSWGGDVIAGEEERGTIDLLLANPITRRRVVLEKWAALVAGVALGALGLGAGLAIGIPATGMRIGAVSVLAAICAVTLLGALFGTLALALGAATGRRGLARGLSVLLAVLAYLLSTLPTLVNWLRPLRPLSPWYHALGVDPLVRGFAPAHLLLVVALGACIGTAGIVAFDRRDLAV